MKIKTMTLAVKRTINLGQFENVAVESGLEVEHEPGERVKDVRSDMLKLLRTNLEAAFDEFKGKQRGRI
jgi:hypothetical protein